MSLVRFIPAWLHAIADYAVALSLIVVALVAGGPGKAVAAGVVIGAVVLVVSMLTRYPLGVIKVLPFKVHSAGDYLAVVLLVASPFALGFSHRARGLTIFYIAAGAAVLLVSLVTNYQYGPQAVRATVRADDRADDDRRPNAPVRTRQPSYPPQGAPQSSYTPEVTPRPTYVRPSSVPQAAPQPTYAPQAEPEPASARPAVADPVPASRPLREILAERAANGRSAA